MSIPTLFFRHAIKPQVANDFYLRKIIESGLNKVFNAEAIAKSQASIRIFTNEHYIDAGGISPSLQRTLLHTASVCIAGDSEGFFQDGRPFPKQLDFFANLKRGDSRGLSPDERLAASKKIIVSQSFVAAHGGYPSNNPKQIYKAPIEVGIFSLAGPQFEMSYLHYALFGLDPFQSIIKPQLFAHLYRGLPLSLREAKDVLGEDDFNADMARMRMGFSFLSRNEKGKFYTSLFKRNAIVFLDKAYERYIYEDVALLLTAVNESAKEAGKPAFLKATAIGMGFFAKLNCQYDIRHHLYPYYLRAFRDLLKTGRFPHIAQVEFPIFTELFEEFYENILNEDTYGGVSVKQSGRDVLDFSPAEQERFYTCIVNPSDANSLPGNEWGYASVESMIGNNTSLRFDQVHLMNPLVLEPAKHRAVRINPWDYSTEIVPASSTFQLK